MPIYRQIIDQIKYQVATGVLREGDKVPSVRELAGKLAVNQNTVLKVYNELCRENVLRIERGDGTYVSSSKQHISASEREGLVAEILREAVVQAVQLDVSLEQAQKLLEKEYETITSARKKSI
ncbi:MAG: GntR family transcriptional regulator [Sedimentisphaerales bacterium]|nr:GntR family transcriptional regulator [Sedimentisphaerales bacterium]